MFVCALNMPVELPECAGTSDYKSGQKMSLACSLPYRGGMPSVNWYRITHPHRRHQHERIQEIKSKDGFDILETPVASMVRKA